MAAYETPAAFLRRMAPAQSHEGRREFLKAAEQLENPPQFITGFESHRPSVTPSLDQLRVSYPEK